MESIPLWQSKWATCCCQVYWSLGQPLPFCLFLLQVPSPPIHWSPATPLALLTLGTLELNWDQFPIYPVKVLVLLVLRSLLSVRFQNRLEYLKNGVYFFSLHWSVYLWGFYFFFWSMFKISFGHNFLVCDLSVLTNLTLCCKAVLYGWTR